jgi:hypothetical protein
MRLLERLLLTRQGGLKITGSKKLLVEPQIKAQTDAPIRNLCMLESIAFLTVNSSVLKGFLIPLK